MPESMLQHPWLWAGVLAAPAAWCAWRSLRPRAQPKEADFNTFLRPGAKSAAQPGKAAVGRQKQAQDFSSFLRNASTQEPRRQATSFSSFIRAPEVKTESGKDADAGSAANKEQATDLERPPPDSKPVAVLFGTEYGFSKEIAEKAAAQLKESGRYWPRLMDMAENPEGFGMENEQALLVVCSTQGDGVPPSEAREFCDWLSGSSAPKLDHTHFSVCALGDTSYAHFCACGKMLDARLEQLGAKRFSKRVDVNREDWKAVDAWIQAAVADLDRLQLKAHSSIAGKEEPKQAAPKQKRWGKSRPYFGTIVASEGLCNISGKDDKDTIRVEIDLGDSGLSYLPGDALGILPLNCYEAVDELLQLLGASADMAVPRPAWHYDDGKAPQSESIPIREALAMCYDLRSPKHELLSLLLESLRKHEGKAMSGVAKENGTRKPSKPESGTAHTELYGNGHPVPANGHMELSNGLTNGHSGLENGHAGPGLSSKPRRTSVQEQTAQLQKLMQQGDAAIEKYLEPRHVIDLLSEYPSARPPTSKVLAALRPLLPRLYSISSSQLEHPTRVQVTVAVVRYASLNRERIGVTSTYLAERLQVGDRIPVYVHKNPDFRLPQDASKPIIMVGPGTGLAPFRSFMQERLLSAQSGKSGPLGQAVLYFGCRRSDQDYLYGSLLEDWARAGHLTLFTAFSRQQAQKVYVQDRLRESGKLVWELLEAGGHFYVCGDAAQMAGAVEQELLQIIESHQGQGRASATAYLDDLTAQQRYQRDVWF